MFTRQVNYVKNYKTQAYTSPYIDQNLSGRAHTQLGSREKNIITFNKKSKYPGAYIHYPRKYLHVGHYIDNINLLIKKTPSRLIYEVIPKYLLLYSCSSVRILPHCTASESRCVYIWIFNGIFNKSKARRCLPTPCMRM